MIMKDMCWCVWYGSSHILYLPTKNYFRNESCLKKFVLEYITHSRMSFGLVGTGSMGSQLAINISKKHDIHVNNRSYSKVKQLSDAHPNIHGHESLVDFISNMETPRTIITMLPHGNPSTEMIQKLSRKLSPDDIIIDCANELYRNSHFCHDFCEKRGIHYFGTGVSGGVLGALNGPALMIGGSSEVYPRIKEFCESFSLNAVHISDDPGSGHFTKMVHNGVEYGMLQGIADIFAYCNHDIDCFEHILQEAKYTFANGYLIDSALRVCKNVPVSRIDGTCKMNDTGLWSQHYALQSHLMTPMLTAALQARMYSEYTDPAQEISQTRHPVNHFYAKQALLFTFASALLEGYAITTDKGLDIEKVKDAWSRGTIIESDMTTLDIEKLKSIRESTVEGARNVCKTCMYSMIPVPTLANGITAYDFERNGNKSTAFVMAQRNDFGDHAIEMK